MVSQEFGKSVGSPVFLPAVSTRRLNFLQPDCLRCHDCNSTSASIKVAFLPCLHPLGIFIWVVFKTINLHQSAVDVVLLSEDPSKLQIFLDCVDLENRESSSDLQLEMSRPV